MNRIIDVLRNKKSFCIASHFLPDGDSIGSSLALARSLLIAGKEVMIYCRDPVPLRYLFLPDSEIITHHIPRYQPDTVLITLDCSDISRAGIGDDCLNGFSSLINIDHHITNNYYGDENLVDPLASATGEIVYEILKKADFPIDKEIATTLYVAILTDTGSFKYENTTAKAHRIIAELFTYGINPSLISQLIYDDHPLSFLLILRNAISSLEVWEGGRIAAFTISREMLQQFDASLDIMDGIINYVKNIDQVEIGILFFVENDGEVKVGLRSKKVDVSVIAEQFYGGGHIRASGFRSNSSYPTTKQKTIEAAIQLLKNADAHKAFTENPA